MLNKSFAIGIPISCAMWLMAGVGVHEMTTHSAYLTAAIARHASHQLILTKRVAAGIIPNLSSKYL
jgi:hypothetical protein